MNWSDALPCHCVGVRAVLQQCGPDVHLVLFGSDVERCVAILGNIREMQVIKNVLDSSLDLTDRIKKLFPCITDQSKPIMKKNNIVLKVEMDGSLVSI